MAEILFFSLLLAGILGAALMVLYRRGLMRNGYFTIGSSLIIALFVIVAYQTLPLIGLLFVSESQVDAPKITLSLSALGQLVVLIGVPLLLIRATEQDTFATLRLEGIRETPIRLYLLTPVIMLLSTGFGSSVSQLWTKALEHAPFYDKLSKLNDFHEETIQKIMVFNSFSDYVFILLAIAVVPAIAEEVFFRGFLQTNIERSGRKHARPYIALAITSTVFALVHLNPFQFPALLALGLAMGYVTYRTNNLLIGSFGHAFNNANAVMIMAMTGNINFEQDVVGPNSLQLLFILIVSGFLLAVAIYLFHQWSEQIEARNFAEEEVRAATTFYAAQELERYNNDLIADLEAREQSQQERARQEPENNSEHKNTNDHS